MPRLNNILNGCVAYWSLEEASGTRVDATGRGNDLTAVNTPGQAAGKVGNCLSLVAASSQYLSGNYTDLDLVGNPAFSIALWAKASTWTDYQIIIQRSTLWASGTVYMLYWRSPDLLQFWGYNSAGQFWLLSAVVGAPTGWVHIVATKDPATATVNLWLNGALTSVSTSVATQSKPGIATTFGAGPIGTLPYWDGLLDEFGFWNGIALSPAAVGYLYNSGAGRSYAELLTV